nr:diguanylate cyclase [Lachnospiraceae bacterium]
MHQVIYSLKKWFGFEQTTAYDKEFLTSSNMSTSVYMSAFTVAMELWMIWYQLKRMIDTGVEITALSLWDVTKNYWLLLAVAAIVFYYSKRYLSEKKSSRAVALSLTCIYALVLLIFGMYVSFHDMSNGKQIISFMNMAFVVACMLVWRPYLMALLLGIVFLVFYHYMEIAAGGSVRSGDRINYFIYWFFLTVLSISTYHHRISESRKTQYLEETNRNLHHMAVTDELTQISNMTNFVMESAQKLRELGERKSEYAFFFINVKSFSNYNDKYSHAEGNELLKKLAARLV